MARNLLTANQLTRRAALGVGGAGFLGLNMPRLLRAADTQGVSIAPTAKSVVFLYQFGGPSHVDTLDVKPNAPAGIRSQFGTIETSCPGIRFRNWPG